MTQPDGLSPAGAFSPISELAAKPQEEWEAEQTSLALGGHNTILTALFTGLPTGMPFPLALLTVLARGILNAPTQVWETVEDVIDDVPILRDVLVVFQALGIDLSSPQAFIRSLIGRISGRVSVSSLTSQNFNLSNNPDFEGPGSFYDPLDRFKYDADVTYADKGGSVRVDADGSLFELLSDPAIPSEPNEPHLFQIRVRWTGLAYTGEPIQMFGATTDVDDNVISETVIASITNPGATSIGRAGADAEGWVLMSATYTALDDDETDGVKQGLRVRETATAGQVWWDSGLQQKTKKINPSDVTQLVEALQDAIERNRTLINTIVNKFRKTEQFDWELADLADALLEIPWENLLPFSGGGNLGESLQNIMDLIVGGWVGESGSGSTPPDLFNIGRWVSAGSFLGRAAAAILGRRTNRPLDGGMPRTMLSNIPLSAVATGSPDTFAVTKNASTIGWSVLAEDQPVGVVRWRGSGNLNITDFRLNIWKMDRDTGGRTLVHRSANIIGDIPAAVTPGDPPPYIKYIIPDPIAGEASDCYGYELEVKTGTGSHLVVGASVWIDPDDEDHPKSFASTRDTNSVDPPSSMSATDDYSTNVPYMEYGIGGTDSDVHIPRETPLTTPGTYSVPIASWTDIIDIVLVPGGGDGADGTLGFYGDGGYSGAWFTKQLFRGTDFDDDTVFLEVTVGARKQASSVAIPDGATYSTAPGVDGTTVQLFGHTVGRGMNPKTITFNNIPYVGGGDQLRYSGNGIAPGGAGAGGNRLPFSRGGVGAPGAVFIVEHAVPDDPDPGETTIPTEPTVELVTATPSTLLIRAFGATDTGGGITGYDFFLNNGRINLTPVASDEDDEATYLAIGLPADTTFSVTAKAINTSGVSSAMSDPVLMATLSGTPAPPEDPALTVEQWAAIDAIVASEMTYGQRGVSVTISGPNGFGSKTYGSAGARPLSLDDHFREGSITKSKVSTALMLLIDQGLISLDDPVSDYLEGIPNGDNIKILHLTNMRSGLPDYQAAFATPYAFNIQTNTPLASIILWIKSQAVVFQPGDAYQYSNSNTIILAEVVRVVSETTPEAVIVDDILTPLGMTETSIPTGNTIPVPFSSGYGPHPLYAILSGFFLGWLVGPVQDQTLWSPSLFALSGNMITTQGDLHRWLEALRDGELVSTELHQYRQNPLEEFGADYTGEGADKFYYLLNSFRIGAWRGVDGSIPGFSSCGMYEKSTGAIITVMENYQTPNLIALIKIWYRIAEFLYPGSVGDVNYGTKHATADAVGVGNASATTTALITAAADGSGTANADISGDDVVSIWTTVAPASGMGVSSAVATPEIEAATDGLGVADADAYRIERVENINLVDEPTPDADGCWVTEIGGGSAGLLGNGGGSGSRVDRYWVPAELLGPTYSTTRGMGGHNGNGTASRFESGDVIIQAGGGTGINGGVPLIEGVEGVITYNGKKGGNAGWFAPAQPGESDLTNNVPAGGGGSGYNGAPGKGGDSEFATGTAGNSAAQPASAGPGNGGAGAGGSSANGIFPGKGGLYGGGGGGYSVSTGGTNGSDGGDGYILVEWVWFS